MAAKKPVKKLGRKDMKQVKGGSDPTISARKAGEKPLEYLQVKLQDVQISSYQTGG